MVTMKTTETDNSVVLDKTIAAHQETVASLSMAIKELLMRLEPVASPSYPEDPLGVLEPKPCLCDIAQTIAKETFYLEDVLNQVRSMGRRLQLSPASWPEDSADR